MVRYNPVKLNEHEKKDPLWWCHRHKDNCTYLVIRLHQLLSEDDDGLKEMMKIQLEEFAKDAGVDLDEIKFC